MTNKIEKTEKTEKIATPRKAKCPVTGRVFYAAQKEDDGFAAAVTLVPLVGDDIVSARQSLDAWGVEKAAAGETVHLRLLEEHGGIDVTVPDRPDPIITRVA